VLIALPVFFKFKNEEIALELFMVSIGSLALSTWYWFRVRKIPELPEALRLAHKALMARLSERLKIKSPKRKSNSSSKNPLSKQWLSIQWFLNQQNRAKELQKGFLSQLTKTKPGNSWWVARFAAFAYKRERGFKAYNTLK
jgi:hypothetical protein